MEAFGQHVIMDINRVKLTVGLLNVVPTFRKKSKK
jgi:hypothetical protein